MSGARQLTRETTTAGISDATAPLEVPAGRPGRGPIGARLTRTLPTDSRFHHNRRMSHSTMPESPSTRRPCATREFILPIGRRQLGVSRVGCRGIHYLLIRQSLSSMEGFSHPAFHYFDVIVA